MYILKNQIVLRRNGKMSTLTIKHMPYGDMAIIAMRGCEEFASKVDYYLLQWRGMPDLLLVQGGLNDAVQSIWLPNAKLLRTAYA